MEAKTQNFITIGSFVVAFAGLGFTLFTRSQDQHAEFYEKEAQYRAKTVQDIQSIKEIHKNELQAHKNEFQEYKLKTQEQNFQQEKKIENLVRRFKDIIPSPFIFRAILHLPPLWNTRA